MAPIYEEIVLAWQGTEYTIHPDYRMVQRIEASRPAGLGISIVRLLTDLETPYPAVTQVGEIMSFMLQSAGAKTATPEEVFAHLVHATTDEWIRIRVALARAFIPQERSSGNSGAPVDGADSESNRPEPAK